MANRVLLNKLKSTCAPKISNETLQLQLLVSRLNNINSLLNNNLQWITDNWNLFISENGGDNKEDYTISEDSEYQSMSIISSYTDSSDIVFSLDEQITDLETRVEALDSVGEEGAGVWKENVYMALQPTAASINYQGKDSTGWGGDIWAGNRYVVCKTRSWDWGWKWRSKTFYGGSYVHVPKLYSKGVFRESITMFTAGASWDAGGFMNYYGNAQMTVTYSLCIKGV